LRPGQGGVAAQRAERGSKRTLKMIILAVVWVLVCEEKSEGGGGVERRNSTLARSKRNGSKSLAGHLLGQILEGERLGRK
jgi:hypothetical protein